MSRSIGKNWTIGWQANRPDGWYGLGLHSMIYKGKRVFVLDLIRGALLLLPRYPTPPTEE